LLHYYPLQLSYQPHCGDSLPLQKYYNPITEVLQSRYADALTNSSEQSQYQVWLSSLAIKLAIKSGLHAYQYQFGLYIMAIWAIPLFRKARRSSQSEEVFIDIMAIWAIPIFVFTAYTEIWIEQTVTHQSRPRPISVQSHQLNHIRILEQDK
jgi:hypothetical protein